MIYSNIKNIALHTHCNIHLEKIVRKNGNPAEI